MGSSRAYFDRPIWHFLGNSAEKLQQIAGCVSSDVLRDQMIEFKSFRSAARCRACCHCVAATFLPGREFGCVNCVFFWRSSTGLARISENTAPLQTAAEPHTKILPKTKSLSSDQSCVKCGGAVPVSPDAENSDPSDSGSDSNSNDEDEDGNASELPFLSRTTLNLTSRSMTTGGGEKRCKPIANPET